MSSLETATLSMALTELTNVNQVYVRLALSRDDSGRYEARCLLIDVIPQRWLDDFLKNESDVLSPWECERGPHLFESGDATFFCGLRESKTVIGWFKNPDDCALEEFDHRPGYMTHVKQFYLPKIQEGVTQQWRSSHALDGLPVLPYPVTLYSLYPQTSGLVHNGDDKGLGGWDSWSANTSYFDNFRVARAELIFGVTDQYVAYQREDRIALRVIRAEGWLKEVQVCRDRVDVTIAGIGFRGSQIVLTPAEVRATSEPILGRHVSLPLPAQLPQQVHVNLLRDGNRLDSAVFSLKDAPYPETSPQVIVKREDCAGYVADEAITSVDTEIEEQIDVANAPKVFISYSHDSQEHKKRVLELANRLRGDGIECRIDRYIASPSEGWPKWMKRQILNWSDYVIVICTKTYARRFNGEEAPGQGLGAVLEGGIITQQIYEQAGNNEKFLPILFSAEDAEYIPSPLRPTTWYLISSEQGYEDLYRFITGQPAVEMPPLGVIKRLPPRGE